MSTPSTHDHQVLTLVREVRDRLILPLLMVFTVFVGGVVGYVIIGHGRWSWFDAIYMTTITIGTVGYGETLSGMDKDLAARAFTVALIWVGFATTVYAGSVVTAFVVERNFGRLLRERRLKKMLDAMRNHFIVCGAGRTGVHIVHELVTMRRPCVVIDLSVERVEYVREHYPDVPVVLGDASDETVLRRAGVERASGVVANVRDDSRNLLIAVQARFANSGVKIIARADDNSLVEKFRRAGADYVVNPSFIGGLRMASQLLRPNTVTFLDRMLRGQDPSIRVDEAIVAPGSMLAGQTLAHARVFETTGLRPIAVRSPADETFHYNPDGSEVLDPGTVLIVIGNPDQLAALRRICGATTE